MLVRNMLVFVLATLLAPLNAQSNEEFGPVLTDLCTMQALKVKDCECTSSASTNLKSTLECSVDTAQLDVPLEYSAYQVP